MIQSEELLIKMSLSPQQTEIFREEWEVKNLKCILLHR